MARRRLTRVIPVRVTPRHQEALRRWAREADIDVSKVVRRMIDDHLTREMINGEVADAGVGTLDQVSAAA